MKHFDLKALTYYPAENGSKVLVNVMGGMRDYYAEELGASVVPPFFFGAPLKDVPLNVLTEIALNESTLLLSPKELMLTENPAQFTVTVHVRSILYDLSPLILNGNVSADHWMVAADRVKELLGSGGKHQWLGDALTLGYASTGTVPNPKAGALTPTKGAALIPLKVFSLLDLIYSTDVSKFDLVNC